MQPEPESNPPQGRPPYGIYAYTGREWDPEIGLYYYRARYYDSKIGRFISEDPIGFAVGENFYAYVSNGPTISRDPLGLFVMGGPYETACAVIIGVYYGEVGERNGWPWTHCMASCQIARHCGKETQVVFGFAKEIYDTAMCLTGRRDSCRSAWQESDFTNNSEGATAPCQMSCEDACNHLKNSPEPSPGPFGDGPWSWY